MKKVLATLLAGALAIGLSGCLAEDTSNENSKVQSDKSDTAVQSKEEKKKDMDISIISTKIGEDYAKEPILLVEYEFTNNTDEATSFTFLCQDTVFQNGVECSSTVISDAVDTQQQLNDVKPGTPYKLTVGYKLQDVEADVEIEIKDLLKTETFLTQTIKLK